MLIAFILHQKQHCGMISGVTRTLKVLAIQLWVAMVHNAGGLGLPEQPGLQPCRL